MEIKAPLKVKAFACLVAHRKVNANDLLQLRRPFKSLNPQWCILCKEDGESVDHIFSFIGLSLLVCGTSFSTWLT